MTSHYRVVTESGAVYLLDFQEGFWKYDDDDWERLYKFKVAAHSEDDQRLGYPSSYPEHWNDATEPQVGRRMYMSNGKMHDWRISTPVVSVEEVAE